MKYVLAVIAVLLLLYLLFSIIPTFFAFLSVFGRSKYREYTEEHLKNSYYAPFIGLLTDSRDLLRSTPCERVSCVSADCTRLSGRLFFKEREKAVILMHGYRADPDCSVSTEALKFIDMGYSVLIPEQRAHGTSGGRFTTMGIRESDDVVAWKEFLDAVGCKTAAVYGISLGGTSVAFASDRLGTIPLIIDCPFISPEVQLRKIASGMKIPLPLIIPPAIVFARLLTGTDFRRSAADTLKNATGPVLFVCGDRDTTISYDNVVKMNGTCPTSRGLITVKGAEHACSCLAGGEELDAAIAEHIGKA